MKYLDDDGTFSYYENGRLHREDGPAIAYLYGNKYKYRWFYNGKEICCNSQKEFEKIIKLKVFW